MMATIKAFRAFVHDYAALSIYSTFLSNTKMLAREAISGYTEEVLAPWRRTVELSTVGATPGFRVDPNRPIDSLQRGERAFQLRVWQINEDRESSSNDVLITAGVEIEVFRKLAFPDEEFLYTKDEMLDSMGKLLSHEGWLALSALDAFVDPPTIEAPPERENDVLRFTVAFSAIVAP